MTAKKVVSNSADHKRLVIFSDDWGRHPSSSQHLAKHLLCSYDIDWVNTMGTRWPQPNLVDFNRIREKTIEWIRPRKDLKDQLPTGLRVFNPIHWPSFGSSLERKLNRALMRKYLTQVLFAPPFPTAVVTTTPIVADLFGDQENSKWIYYCVDNLAEWPGLRREVLYRLERDLLSKCDRIICVSDAIATRLQKLGYESDIITHGVDLPFWKVAVDHEGLERQSKSCGLPNLLFWGTVDDRLDAALCLTLLERFRVRFVGPIVSVHERIRYHPNAEFLGPVAFGDLPMIARGADALVIPYAMQNVTMEMQPLKLKEYLATGRPVIASDLPAYAQWMDAMDIAHNHAEFSELCMRRAGKPIPPEQSAARARLEEEAWSAKASVFSDLLSA